MRTLSLIVILLSLQIFGVLEVVQAMDRSSSTKNTLRSTPSNQVNIAPGVRRLPAGAFHPASDNLRVLRSTSQAEQMLTQLKSPQPAFAKSKRAPASMMGVCRTSYGAYFASAPNSKAYQDCIDPRSGSSLTHITGAATLFVLQH